MAAEPIDYCIRDHFLMPFQVKVSLRVRGKMLAAMPLERGMNVLEVGVTPDMTFEDQNYFSKGAAAMGCRVSVTSIEDCSAMAVKNQFTWIPYAELLRAPRADYDCVISAAVIEHISGRPAKLDYLRFLGRLSRRYIVVTMPNRGHWFEVHTKLPFIHWLPKSVHRGILRRIGLARWAADTQLDLLWGSEFRQICRDAFPHSRLSYRPFWLFGAVSNWMAIIEVSSAKMD